MYTDWKVGDEIKICVATDMFCGQLDYFYFINDFDIQKVDTTCSVQYGTTTICVDENLNNLPIKVYTVDESFGSIQHGICSDVPDNYKLRYLGNANTNNDGVCTISTIVTEQDLTDFNDTPEGQYKLFICIDNEKVGSNDYIPSITISSIEIPEKIEYLDIYIKPHFWYEDKYENAINDIINKITEIDGKIFNYMSSITGYEYVNTEILRDEQEEFVIIRINYTETLETSLVAPIIIAAATLLKITIVIVGIIAIVGIIYNVVFSKPTEESTDAEELLEDIDTGIDNALDAGDDEFDNRTTDVDEAKLYTAYNAGVQAGKLAILSQIAGVNPDENINEILANMRDIINGLDDGTYTPEDIDNVIKEYLTDIADEKSKDLGEEIKSEECFIDNPLYPLKSDNPCLITNEQATWIKYGAIGIAGLYVFSTVAPIIKGTGKIFEKKVSK